MSDKCIPDVNPLFFFSALFVPVSIHDYQILSDYRLFEGLVKFGVSGRRIQEKGLRRLSQEKIRKKEGTKPSFL